MQFEDRIVNVENRFSIGTERSTGKHYVSIPVSNGLVEYEEYYEIDAATFERFVAEPLLALPLIDSCRHRREDHRLIVQPGRLRGEPI